MPSTGVRKAGTRRRLHPAGIAIYAVHALGRAIFPLLIILALSLLGGRGGGDQTRTIVYGLVGIVGAAIAGYVRWSTTTYAVDERAIHHHTGLIRQSDTDVPLTRVEALDVQQGPLQRLFGVQAVHVQTGGGGGKGGEIVLPALRREAVRELRERVGAPAPTVDPGPRLRLGPGSLLLGALTAGQMGIIVPVVAAGFQVAQQAFEEGEGRSAVHALPDTLGGWLLVASVLLGAAWALSAAGAAVAFAGFTVARDGDRLRIRRGLVSRREATIPVDRVRAVRVVEGALRRPFGLAALHMEVTGYAEEAAVARTLFPLLRTRGVRDALGRLLPELADEPGGLARPPARAQRRYLLVPVVAGLAAGAAVAVVVSSPWPLAALLAGLAYGRARWRAAGWRLRDGRLAVRSLLLARTTVLAPARNRESHELAQSVLQRRARLADLRVDFGKSTAARIRHLDEADATAAWEALAS
jgi:putative membrane protein